MSNAAMLHCSIEQRVTDEVRRPKSYTRCVGLGHCILDRDW